MSVVKKFNGLNGSKISRAQIVKMIAEAKDQEQFAVAARLEKVLANYPEATSFKFSIHDPAIEVVPDSILFTLDQESENHEQVYGLGKPVTPNEIYSYVTDLILNTIQEVGHLPWQKEWQGSGNDGQARNYVSKRPYSGINFVLLNFDIAMDEKGKPYLVPIEFEQPYYLTFNQINEAKATLKKGAKAHRVVYYSMLYNYKSDSAEFKGSDRKAFETFVKENGITKKDMQDNLTRIPMLKYYNVFRADDCTGLKFPKLQPTKKVEPIAACQAIIDNYPKPPRYTFIGDKASYAPTKDVLNMPKIEAFNFEAAYYSTFFHEMVHSTGHKKRLDRDFENKTSKKDYAFEELVAELGAVFLCSEAGILFQTRENSAKYLSGWNSRLTKELKEDNRFFLKAAAQSQKAADHILDADADGVPKYLQLVANEVEKAKPVKKTKPKQQAKEIKGYAIVDNVSGQIIASKETLPELKAVYKALERKKAFTTLSALVYEVIKVKGKNKLGALVEVNWDSEKQPFKKLTKEKLEQANPKPFANKPKSVSVASAIDDILATGNYPGIKPMQANVLYTLTKDIEDFEEEIDLMRTSEFQDAILNGISNRYIYKYDSVSMSVNADGVKLITAIKNRIDSKKNQKTNYALFDGLKRPLVPEAAPQAPVTEPKPAATVSKDPRIQKIGGGNNKPSEFYTVQGEVGKFLQRVERKPVQSVVITMDGEQGAGKTTTLYHFIEAFAAPGNKCLYISGEEHPDSTLATDKKEKYLSEAGNDNLDTIPEVTGPEDLYNLVKDYDVVFIDSWQKLVRMNCKGLRLDEDLRKRFNGKVFVIIFQQTTDGRTKGGAEVVFDGDIIIKMVKEARFSDNYAYFDKNRYTQVPLETIRYNIASGTCYNPEAPAEPEPQAEPVAESAAKPKLLFKAV
ncbi:DUF1738 domain-containing protein [Flavobacterium sp. Sd200]|uniref:zincin-like metallopeptidase domain-containing protein n=1 Tax=Flavobacterium sp. Sd200 TaxID=2692211 RepID=UPI001367FAFD|nr:zincin-like metallopeptidase domain-containing protein [Flavobacterium sp. Sd200]MXN90142.1 DUF1738 domain-containing protein [Flavobacterium sp. Sd200]